jgi:transcriptional regulator with XRE-family HTH domain
LELQKSPTEYDRWIGQRIKARRLIVGMSQERLGAALGITFQQVQKYEKGVNRIGAGRLHQVAEVLGVGTAYFYDGMPASGPVPDDLFTSMMNTPHGLRLARAFDAISDTRLRRRALELVEAIAKVEEAA